MYPATGKKAEKSQMLTEKLAQTLREAEETLRLTKLRVESKKKLIAYKNQAIKNVADIEQKLEACKNNKGSFAAVKAAVKVDEENQEGIRLLMEAIAEMK